MASLRAARYGCLTVTSVHTRTRKLLLNRSEIRKLIGRTTEKGLTLVPLRVYLKNGRLKCELALAKGRKLHDKREVSRMKTIDKEARQAISQRK